MEEDEADEGYFFGRGRRHSGFQDYRMLSNLLDIYLFIYVESGWETDAHPRSGLYRLSLTKKRFHDLLRLVKSERQW